MNDRFSRFPAYLAERSRWVRLGPVPAVLAHPDWERPAPTVIWMHGRSVNKELDPGRYLRWVRAGIAACAIDLPGHGERADAAMQAPARTLDVLAQAVGEIDGVVEGLADAAVAGSRGVFDLERLGIGGMSAGGMVALRRLCDPHPFRAGAVEATTGDLGALYHPETGRPWPVSHPPGRVEPLDPMRHLSGWRPIPLLALHSESDAVVPVAGQRGFIGALREHCRGAGADPDLVRFVTWQETGAAQEHMGFGRFSNDAKNLQTEFLARVLGAPTYRGTFAAP
ncbi:MAG: prolyl oligopeptidase family serine peptidase [Phycisphaerales bacterium]|nr:prolyl oligopeptidase family serine peptidase [Phycisphaerales bacterium]